MESIAMGSGRQDRGTMRRGGRRLLVGACLLALIATARPVRAQDWAKAMFKETTHDFGFVAAGAIVEHRFKLENIYLEDAHIASLSSSCGCTKPTITKNTLKTYETAEVVARLDTERFQGRKDATVRVIFDKPYPAEVQLHVHSYIRSDVVLNPGEISFGSVRHGEAASAQMTLNYAGRDDWGLVEIKRENPHLDVKAVETKRGNRQVGYQLEFTLRGDAPAGYFREYVRLITNDLNSNATEILVTVEGTVVKAVSVSPETLTLGAIHAGQSVKNMVAVKAEKPFHITEILCDDPRITAGPLAPEDRPLQLVPVTFTADATAGEISTVLKLKTNLESVGLLEVPVKGSVTAESSHDEESGEAPSS